MLCQSRRLCASTPRLQLFYAALHEGDVTAHGFRFMFHVREALAKQRNSARCSSTNLLPSQFCPEAQTGAVDARASVSVFSTCAYAVQSRVPRGLLSRTAHPMSRKTAVVSSTTAVQVTPCPSATSLRHGCCAAVCARSSGREAYDSQAVDSASRVACRADS